MAAGAWTSGAGIGDVNQALTSKAIQFALHASIKNMGIIASPAVQAVLARDEGLGPMLGALGIRVGLAAVGQGKMASTAEGTEASATNWSLTNAELTPARREHVRSVGDYARSLNEPLLTGELGRTAVATVIRDSLGIWSNTFVDLITALAASATYSSGTTGTAYTWNAFHHLAIDMTDRGSSGAKCALITAKAVKDLADDSLSLGGAVQMSQQVQQFLDNATSGYVGRFFSMTGGGIDLYMCSENDTSGGDTLGVCFGSQGIHSKHQAVRLPAEADAIFQSPMFSIEARRPGGGVSYMSTVSHNAAGILDQSDFAKIVYAT